MSIETVDKKCVIIGASHGGVNFSFALRKEGWQGSITLIDKDPLLPYHRPPLSKTYLTKEDGIHKNLLKSEESYQKANIDLMLGIGVTSIDRDNKEIVLSDDSRCSYDKLVLATGARPLIPQISGIENADKVHVLRTAVDVERIRKAVHESSKKRVVIIGGGYIGLEIAASLKKLEATVTVLEREERVLARVTIPEMSHFFMELHDNHGVKVHTDKNVTRINSEGNVTKVVCADATSYEADLVIVGVGILVNQELAEKSGLVVKNGIQVDEATRTSDKDIYAIGDCSFHFNSRYKKYLRLESVQNAIDQSKIAAASVYGRKVSYNAIPWFWSDQYDVKLQMVGLSDGYDRLCIRKEEGEAYKFSIWYFKDKELLAIDAVNHPKAYVVGTKILKDRIEVDPKKIMNVSIALKPGNLLAD